MIEQIKKLTVKYNSRIVGYLAEVEENQIAFQYDDEWLKAGFSISPFLLQLSNKIFVNNKRTFDGLYGVFWDSLPDGWGELLVRRMLAKKGINADNLSPLQKLSLISNNGLGGLTYEPNKAFQSDDIKFTLDELAEEVQQVLKDDSSVNLDKIYEFGGSSGGARPKAHIEINDKEWIIKFPCRIDPQNAGEQEYKANILAQKCGINVNEFKLFPSNRCSGYFGAERFDRENGKRVHMISLSALLETSHRLPNLDYYHLFQVIEKICVNKEDLYEAYRRMCFNVFYKNRDDHGKNFAFLYDEELKGYKLSPAYDLTSTPNKSEHEMTICGNGIPTEKDLINVAKDFKLSMQKCKEIIERIKKIIY